jgi:predicted DNA-binding transcriptional regulator AlpA
MQSMAKVDTSELINAQEVAPIIGLTNPNGVSVLRRRHPDFPTPAVEKGQCVLWLKADIVAWAKARSR